MDSIADVVFDSRLISQSSSVRNSVSPPKRIRLDEENSSDWSPAPFERESEPVLPSSASASHQIGEAIQHSVVPQVLAQVPDRFLQMNAHFSTSASQASKLFADIQPAVGNLSEHQQVLHHSASESQKHLNGLNLRQQALFKSTQESHNLLHTQRHTLHGVQMNQNVSLAEQAVGQRQIRNDIQRHDCQTGAESAQAVHNLRNDVNTGFLRTEQVLVGQEDRIRRRSRELLSAVEDPQQPWRPTSTTRTEVVHGISDGPYSSRNVSGDGAQSRADGLNPYSSTSFPAVAARSSDLLAN